MRRAVRWTAAEDRMPVLPKRPTFWVFLFAVAIAAVVGLADEAAAQVYTGTLDFDDLPPLSITVTLNPGGPASYRVTTLTGQLIDNGLLAANVNGSRVTGSLQSTRFLVRPCEFTGSYDGTVASLVLDNVSCGGGGTLTLSRAG